MLEVVIEGVGLQLPPKDFGIDIEIANPFFSTDRIPVAISPVFEIPASPHNLSRFGNPQRIASSVDYKKEHPGEIRFSGLTMVRGVFILGEVTSKTISLQFKGGDFPKNIRKHLQDHNIGTEEVGKFKMIASNRPPHGPVLDTWTAVGTFRDKLEAQAKLAVPDYVAAPLSIRDREPESSSANDSDMFSNLRLMRVNSFRPVDDNNKSDLAHYYFWGYLYMALSLSKPTEWGMTKILPAFRVGYIMDHLFEKPILGNVFNSDFNRLMLICSHASNYQTADNSIVWSVSGETASMHFADYMPDIAANEFISEVLKLPCATMFVSGDKYSVEYNEDILKRPAPEGNDWSSKLEDGYTISIQPGEDYTFSLTDSNSDTPAEREMIEVQSIQDMVTSLNAQKIIPDSDLSNVFCYKINQTEQVFEACLDPLRSDENNVHWRLKLLSQSPSANIEKDSTSERGSFDMSMNGSACKTVVVDYFCSNSQISPIFKDGKSVHIKCVMPEVEINTKEPQRRNDLLFGLWHGMQQSPKNYFGESFEAPLISHSNYLPNGIKNGELALTNEVLLQKYHHRYKRWVEADKKKINGNVRLSATEINQLDLRNKIHLHGRDFLASKVLLSFTLNSILPSEAEFVEDRLAPIFSHVPVDKD